MVVSTSPLPCLPGPDPLGQMEEGRGGMWRHLWRFSSHNIGLLASSQEVLLVLISKVKCNAMGHNRRRVLTTNHMNVLQKCLKGPVLSPALSCALWWNFSQPKKYRSTPSVNASSITAPKVFQSLFRTAVMLANASKHISQARLPLMISSMWIWGWAGATLTWHSCFRPKQADNSWGSYRE